MCVLGVGVAMPAAAQDETGWYTSEDVDEAVQEALEQYKKGQRPKEIQKSTRVVWPFDESQPEIVCSPDYLCMVALEPGEIVAEDAGGLGDSLRWSVQNVTSPGTPPIVHVMFKPTEFGLRTNAVIVTDRRTYHLTLTSPTVAEIKGGAEYVRHASFYYPADFVMHFKQKERQATRRAAEKPPEGARAMAIPSDLDFDYRVHGKKRLPWRPHTVFNDGERTFLRFSSKLNEADLPTVLATSSGITEAVNFHWNEKQTLVVDGLYRRLQLVVGTGKNRKVVNIYRGLS